MLHPLLDVQQQSEQYFLVPIFQDVQNIERLQDLYHERHKVEDDQLAEVIREIPDQLLVEKMFQNFDNKNQHE